MKGFTGILTTWIVIILFLAILFFVYNRQQDERYLYLGEDAPIPTEVHPLVEESKHALVERAAEKDIAVIITAETRSFERQNQLYKQGRSTEGNIVTNAEAGESYHNYGLAIDYAIEKSSGEITWDIHYDGNENGESDWFEVAEIGKELGFEWGETGTVSKITLICR